MSTLQPSYVTHTSRLLISDDKDIRMKLQKSKFLYNEYYLLTVSLDSLSLSPSLSLSLSLSLSRTHTLSAFHVLLGHTPISSTPHTALAPHLSSGQHAPLPLEPPPPLPHTVSQLLLIPTRGGCLVLMLPSSFRLFFSHLFLSSMMYCTQSFCVGFLYLLQHYLCCV